MRTSAIFPLSGLCLFVLHADVTLRYESSVKTSSFLPPQVAEQAQNHVPALSVQLKNGKSYSKFGSMISICDFATQTVSLLDPAHKAYATLPFAEMSDKLAALIPPLPDQSLAAMQSVKTTSESKKTGKTDVIQGVRAEETEVDLAMVLPKVAGHEPAPRMNLVMHFWLAEPGEALRLPAVREFAGYASFAMANMSPLGSLQKMAGNLPGFGDTFGALLKDLCSKTTPMLRMTVELYMPFLAALPQAAAFDPTTPVMTLTTEAVEFTSAPVDGAMFQVPDGYTSVAADDLLRAVFPSPAAAPSAPAR